MSRNTAVKQPSVTWTTGVRTPEGVEMASRYGAHL